MTAVMGQYSHVNQQAQVWEQGVSRTLAMRSLVTRTWVMRTLVIRTLVIGTLVMRTLVMRTLGKGSLLDSSDRAPEEACELDVPASNVAVIEGNMQLGIQLCCLQQADVGRQHCGSDVAPMAGDGCCVCIWHAHTDFSSRTLGSRLPPGVGGLQGQRVGALTIHLGLRL